MIEKAKNKAMQPEDTQNKEVAKHDGKEEYHFAGEGKYKPLAVRAANQDEANALWEKDREEV